MPSDLETFVAQAPLADTHEHLQPEEVWTANSGDILTDLFGNYVPADFHSSGCDPAALAGLLDTGNPDVAARFAAVRPAWEHLRHTGYGEAVRAVGRLFYELDELTPESIAAAAPRAAALRRPGQRLRILRDQARLEHCQIDNFCWPCPPDPSGPDFFLYDLSWCSFCDGSFDLAAVTAETGIDVTSLESLRAAMAAIFARHAPTAVAVKSQHAYSRTLAWVERTDAEAAAVLGKKLSGLPLSRAEADVIGDWCWARGVELTIEHHLPFKLHCGYYAGNDRMVPAYIPAGHLSALLTRYPQARFVLMHAAWPYTSELVALTKHYRNVWADCCWAWSMNPYQIVRFVREFIHAAPINKLLAFGGDTAWPTAAAAYAEQARRWLARALTAEVADGDLTEPEAIGIAEKIMHRNQRELFDLDGKRKALATTHAPAETLDSP